MRIAIVGTDLCPVDARGGGLEQVVRRWARWLAARHEVIVVSHGGAPDPHDPYRTVTVATRGETQAALSAERPDVVSLHNRPHWAGLCPAGAEVAVTFHNYPGAWKVPARSAGPLRARVATLRLSAVSAALAAAAGAHLGVDDVAVTSPSIDDAYLAAPGRRPDPVVLVPNRLLRKKGVEDLLAVADRPGLDRLTFAFADLISPWARPTAEHRALRRAVAAVPNAELFRPVACPTELAAMYAAAVVVACPAREDEGLGLVPLEAQACGAPVVTTDRGGLREATFAPNECVPPGDLDALARALRRAAGASLDPAGRGGEREPARRITIERHSPAAAGAAFEDWLLRA